MDRFFNAQSVAVIGVSTSLNNLGQIIMYNLLEFRYQGCIYPVGPRGGTILGHRIYKSVSEIPESVELAVILVPATAVPEILDDCGRKGIRRVIVESAGFRELGTGRTEVEEHTHQVASKYGMRIIGPNCIGVINRWNGLAVPFMPFKAEVPLGQVAVVAQSGGVGAAMINSLAAERIGLSKFASIGNKLDVNEIDLIDYLIEDEQTDIIFCYLEGVSDGRRLMKLGQRSPKPIIVHKSNTGSLGAVIAQSHTASMATDEEVVSAAFRQCGILRVREQREALEIIKGLKLPRMAGTRLAIVSVCGTLSAMAVDAAAEFCFELASCSDDLAGLRGHEAEMRFSCANYPLDLGNAPELGFCEILAGRILRGNDADGLVFIHDHDGSPGKVDAEELVSALERVVSEVQKPIALCMPDRSAVLGQDSGVSLLPVFTEPREAIRALAANYGWHQKREVLALDHDRPPGLDHALVRSQLDRLYSGPIPAEHLGSILTGYGIPVISWERVEGEEAVVSAAERLGFPVVLKTACPDVLHKSDRGGVFLDLRDEASLRAAHRRLLRIGSEMLVQEMAAPGMEWLVGGRQDQSFGPVLVFGLGGIYVEVLKEMRMRIAPVSHAEAVRLIDGLLFSPQLATENRGALPSEGESLVDLMVRVSWLLADFPEIRELDLNPVRTSSKGCAALDWRAVRA